MRVVVVLIVLVCVGCIAKEHTPKVQVGFGYVGATDFEDTKSSLLYFEGEKKFGYNVSLAGRLMYFDYNHSSTEGFRDFREEGSSLGVGAEVRYYPEVALWGPYIGAGLGWFPWATWEVHTGGQRFTGRDIAVLFYGSAGWVIRLKRNFAITPSIIFGNYSSNAPKVGPLFGIGLGFSFEF